MCDVQAVAPLVKAAKRAILITGTPALSRPIELYPQVTAWPENNQDRTIAFRTD